jgi:hypothetical protein
MLILLLVHITALPILAEHARYKVWVKANGEMRMYPFYTIPLYSLVQLLQELDARFQKKKSYPSHVPAFPLFCQLKL